MAATASAPRSHLEVLLPQISWHAKDPIQSVDASATANLIATAGNDNEVRLWRMRRQDAVPVFVQSLQGHSKVSERTAQASRRMDDSRPILFRELSPSPLGQHASGQSLRAISIFNASGMEALGFIAKAPSSRCGNDGHLLTASKSPPKPSPHRRRAAQVVNVVRFCPLGVTLASAGDDALIMLWREKAARQAFGEAAPAAGATAWGPVCALRGHCEDVYDLCWSPRADSLFSGGVDGTTIVWNVGKAKPAQIIREHEHYVQGVAWDPQDEHLVSVSLDRTARLYTSPKVPSAGKAPLRPDEPPRDYACHTVLSKRTHSLTGGGGGGGGGGGRGGAAAADEEAASSSVTASSGGGLGSMLKGGLRAPLFLDDSVSSFYRRPTWSPDGSFLLLPCGQYFPDQPPPLGTPKPTTFVFARGNLATPCAHLPSPDKAVIAIRCCPRLFARRANSAAAAAANSAATEGEGAAAGEGAGAAGGQWMGALPYRVIWAVATLSSICVYDSAEKAPLVIASHTHYEPLTDLAWLPDGLGLIASSIDGYCTLLRFRPGILGTPLPADKLPACMRPEAAATPKPAATISAAFAAPMAAGAAPAAVGGGVQVLQVRHKPKAEATGPAAAPASSEGGAPPPPSVRRIAPVAISTTGGTAPAPAVRRVAPTPVGGSAEAEAKAEGSAAAAPPGLRRVTPLPVPVAPLSSEAGAAVAPSEGEAPPKKARRIAPVPL